MDVVGHCADRQRFASISIAAILIDRLKARRASDPHPYRLTAILKQEIHVLKGDRAVTKV
jgi:hypothetical protein